MLGLGSTPKLDILFTKGKKKCPIKPQVPCYLKTHSLKLFELAAVNLIHEVIN